MPKLLILLLSLLLTACASAPVVSVQSSTLPPASMLPVTEEAGDGLRYTVELETWEQSSQTEDGTPLVSCVYNLPAMHVVRADGSEVSEAGTEQEIRALEVAEAFNQEFTAWTGETDFEELTQEARADLEWRQTEQVEWTTGYVLELDCTVYQTEKLISVTGIHYNHLDGAAHPNMWYISWNYDLEAGEFFTPDFLGEDTELHTAVTEEIVRQANAPVEDGIIPAENYWEDYAEIAANWNTTAVAFDGEDMVVTFSPYELAAFGFGPQAFRISYGYLEPYLSDHGRELLGLSEG